MNPDVRIELALTATDDVRALVDELETVLAAEYSPEQRHGKALDALFQPHIRFFLARLDGAAVGCGGVALFDDFARSSACMCGMPPGDRAWPGHF